MRAAEKPREREALTRRLEAAEASAKSRGSIDVLNQFRKGVSSSQAVICRSLSQVMQLVSSDNELYASFYQLVGMGARRPEDSTTERERLLADDLLFPNYREQIRFAALSLDGLGASDYGDCSLVLRDVAIFGRTPVFEENSLYFCSRMSLGFGNPVPPGYRAVWGERDQLAAAKLEPRLSPGTNPRDFAGILLKVSAGPSREEFVEVHIYGSLHRRSIERVVVRRPKRKSRRAILKEIERSLSEVGASLEIQ